MAMEADSMRVTGWNGKRKRLASVIAAAMGLGLIAYPVLLAGCAALGPHHETVQAAPDSAEQPAAAAPAPGRCFEEAGELDKMLDAKPIALAAVRPAGQAGTTPTPTAKAPDAVVKGKGNFRLQIGAESDVDAAQAKKAEYEKQLGGTVDMVFDAPYYKLRWGYCDTKEDAEDKLLELSNDQKIQGFVVKQ
jgi:hypothetical protein